VVGVAAVHRENLAWTATPAPSNVARASAVLMFAFLGVESALVPSGEVVNPARTVPRAIFVAMLGVTLLYLAVQIVAQGILGPALAEQKTPLAEAAAVVMGPSGRLLVLIGSTLSMFGYLGAMTLSGPRILFALARDGFLPSTVSLVHPRFHTPHVAIVADVLVVIALSVTGTFEKLGIIANGSILLVYAACCAAVIELRRRNVRTEHAPFRAPLAGLVPVLAFGVIAWILSSLSVAEWKAMAIVFAVGVATYFVSLPSRRAGITRMESTA
jgi:amino acid transporter